MNVPLLKRGKEVSDTSSKSPSPKDGKRSITEKAPSKRGTLKRKKRPKPSAREGKGDPSSNCDKAVHP